MADMTDLELAELIHARAKRFVADADRISDDARRMTKLSESFDQQALRREAAALRGKAHDLFMAVKSITNGDGIQNASDRSAKCSSE